MTQQATTYRLDAEDRISSVGEEWLEFAQQNGAIELVPEQVLGRPIWDFVTGKETCHFYGLIFAAARSATRPLTIPFRCDSPTTRRYMELRLDPLAAGALDLAARLLKQEQRSYVPLLDPRATRREHYLEICSWCKRVQASGQWLEVESAVARLGLFGEAALPGLTHGVCNDCYRRVLAEVRR